ncbi:MAG: AAA family ATPase [Saprospiraceae bacterium]
MHINRISIQNIRATKDFEMVFEPGKQSGWHVLIGDNGAGKSSVIRAISAALVGPEEIKRLDPNFATWVTEGASKAHISLDITRDESDRRSGQGGARGGVKDIYDIVCQTVIEQNKENGRDWEFKDKTEKKGGAHPSYYFWGNGSGWFSAAFGPYRRFNGGTESLATFYVRNPKIGAHLTIFKEDAALTETEVWLKDLLLRSLSKQQKGEGKALKAITGFVNQDGLLPEGYRLEDITADGLFFSTPSGKHIQLYELSEGIKSVTSLAFEMMRLLMRTYGADEVFPSFLDNDKTNDAILTHGVVLIDEIDAHLHPVWQTRIGQWFTRCFPNIQFIVTTHSPLVCRACEDGKGSIWRLPKPGTEEGVRQITGAEKDKLVYGNILDAYGTNAFGENLERNPEGVKLLEQLGSLTQKKMYGMPMTKAEEKQFRKLSKIFQTDAAVRI